jgi:hypothetical protein
VTERIRLPGGIGSIIAAVYGSGGGRAELPSVNRQPGETVGAALRRAGLEQLAREHPAPPPEVPSDYYPPSTPEFPSDTPPEYFPPPGRDDDMIVVPPLGPDDDDEPAGIAPPRPETIADVQAPPRVNIPSSSSSSPGQPPVPSSSVPPEVFERSDIITHDYEGFDLPGEYHTMRVPRGPVMPGELVRAVPSVLRGIGSVLRAANPIGIIIDAITPGGLYGPEVLGSGELPYPDETVLYPWPLQNSTPQTGVTGSGAPRPVLEPISLPPSAVRLPVPAQSVPSSPPAPSSPSAPSSPTSSSSSSRSSTPPSRSSMTLPRARNLVWPIVRTLVASTILRGSQTTQAAFSWPSPAPSTPVLPIAEPITPPRPTDPLTPPRPTTGSDPLTPPTPTSSSSPLTGLNATSASFPPTRTPTRTRTKECRCDDRPKKRKKPRECLARGDLVWSSGPKKGQSAGSRCLKF